MVQFYSPTPNLPFRLHRAPVHLFVVRCSPHAVERLVERCGMTADQLAAVLTDDSLTVCLEYNSSEDRTYFLFFAPGSTNCFVAIATVSGRTANVITILTKEMWERDRGMIYAEELRAAACAAMSSDSFAAWSRTFDWAAQRFHRHHLRILATYTAADGSKAQVDVGLSPPVNESLSGGQLHELANDHAFLGRLNVDICSSLGPAAVEALAALQSLEVIYGPHIVLADLLALGGEPVRERFRNRRVRRRMLTLFVSFFHDLQLVQLQRTGPPIPDRLQFENLLSELHHCDEFLLSVISLIRTVVPEDQLDSAIKSIQELQVAVASGCTINIVTDEDRAAIQQILFLSQLKAVAPPELITAL